MRYDCADLLRGEERAEVLAAIHVDQVYEWVKIGKWSKSKLQEWFEACLKSEIKWQRIADQL